MFALVTPSPPPPIILVPQQPDMGDEATPEVHAMRRRSGRDNSYAFPVEEFVEAVQQHRFLFDRNEPDFKNVARKEAMWEAIGLQFGVSGNKAMSKWRNMRDKYFKVRKQGLLNRRLRTPRFQRPVKMWPFYNMMRQVFERKHAPSEGSQLQPAECQGDIVADLEFDSTWVTDGNVQAHDPDLASTTPLHTDSRIAVTVKQERPDEVDASDHEASLASGGEDITAAGTDNEDLDTLASLQQSITLARALFHKRRKDFKNAVESLEQRPTSTEASCPDEAREIPRCDTHTQTVAPLPVMADDGLEHFGLFVAQRLRMADVATQARVMSAILKLVVDVPSGHS